jgi:lipoprotein-releasing system ATP-binding protein
MNEAPVLACRGLAKTYSEGRVPVTVLSGVNLEVRAGEVVAIVGASGSGKSTLLHLLGGLDAPSAGEVDIMGRPMTSLSDAERGRLRNEALGFVYQFHHLLNEFTAVENVAMPLRIRGLAQAEAEAQAAKMLDEVGLGARLEHTPGELSGGERQRAALMRALMLDPPLLLLDEPLAALDPLVRSGLQRELRELFARVGKTVLIVTHDIAEAVLLGERVVLMRCGQIEQDGTARELLEAPVTEFARDFVAAQRGAREVLAEVGG